MGLKEDDDMVCEEEEVPTDTVVRWMAIARAYAKKTYSQYLHGILSNMSTFAHWKIIYILYNFLVSVTGNR